LHNQLVLMTAQRDAVVLSVAKISVGSVVTSAEPLIQLVPIDTPLSVEADISGVESGYVSPGDEVRIKFDTLPFLRYGAARGVVRTISADSFSPEAVAKDGGSTPSGGSSSLYYRARISLEKLNLHNTPAGFRPVPGMPITADVKVGTRSVLSYFIDRILPVAVDGLREP
jgi:HlyD family secretion protein